MRTTGKGWSIGDGGTRRTLCPAHQKTFNAQAPHQHAWHNAGPVPDLCKVVLGDVQDCQTCQLAEAVRQLAQARTFDLRRVGVVQPQRLQQQYIVI